MSADDECLAQDLSAALRAGAVQPFFQPIVSLGDGRIVGLEVLARWHDCGRGPVSPEEFIPIADRFGLLDSLLDHVMRTAFRAARDWPLVFLGFNVAPTQLHDPELATRIAHAATELSFPLSRVHIEVTESSLIEDLAQSKLTLEHLIRRGCVIAMDDFGTGYSSLTWLSSLPFSKLKIDASFVRAMTMHRQSRKIVAAVIALGHSLGLAVVAEGVEHPDQAHLLTAMGCQLAQGFLFRRPLPAAQIPTLLEASPHPLPSLQHRQLPLSLEARSHQLGELYRSEQTAIAFLDPGGTVVAASPAFEHLIGAGDGTVTGHRIWELIAVTPETLAQLRATDLLGEPFPTFEGAMIRTCG